MSPWRVIIVDDHAVVLSAIASLVDLSDEFEVVATCSDADEAARATLVLSPDLLMMDIDMPGVSSFDTARFVRQEQPEVRIAFLSAFAHDGYIERAIDVGATGFITKHEPPGVVLSALRRIVQGGTFFSDEVKERLVLTRSVHPKTSGTKGGTRLSTLSPREIQVLSHIASGLSKKDIAGLMHLSVKTVDNHSTNLMSKLDIHDRVELTKYAIREGLATL